jgi:tetratricopeptide (TPR) repeat protein
MLSLTLLVGGGLLAWKFWKPKDGTTEEKREADMERAMEVNIRGIGHMERFDYDSAGDAFEQVRKLAPDWVPGRINLALARLNEAGKIQPDGGDLSKKREVRFEEAIEIYKEILEQETEKRWLTYAHYGLGLIYYTRADIGRDDLDNARLHLGKALELDPLDAHTQYRFGLTLQDDPKRAADCFRKALDLDPYLGSALYSYITNPHVRASEKAERIKQLKEEHERMSAAELFSANASRYTELGFYGLAIGRTTPEPAGPEAPLPLFLPADNFKVQLGPDTRWVTDSDLGTDDLGDLRRLVRQRFGGTLVLLDYNRDGRIDIFLLGAVVRKGKIGNLLLKNEGDGRFTDATERAGLGAPHVSLGCSVADFDNNGYPDLFLTGVGEQRLYRNQKGTFEDVTAQAGLDQLKGVCLCSAFVDLDQDGDRDLLVSHCGETPKEAVKLLKEGGALSRAALSVFTNNGMAYPQLADRDPPPLEPKFVPFSHQAFASKSLITAIAISDVDLDLDVDLFLLPERGGPELVFNDRLLRFRRHNLPASQARSGTWSGALVLDVNRDERSDLLLLSPDREPQLLIHEPHSGTHNRDRLFRQGEIRSPILLQAQAIDLDLDGQTDVLGLSAQRLPVLLHNEGGRLRHIPAALGGEAAWTRDILAVVAADLNGDGLPDIIAWSASKGLELRTQVEGRRKALLLELSGHRRTKNQQIMRTNADGFGSWVVAHARAQSATLEYGTLFAGLGQSSIPLVLGLGMNPHADVVRVRWPDNVWQAEFAISAGQVKKIEEENRKTGSCPVLFAWDGKRFGFVTDFLGAGTLGETQPDGSYRQPRPEESVKIEAQQLVPHKGELLLKIAEPMDEVTYLDRLQLLVIDHPPEASVYLDERMATAGPQPSQDLLSFSSRIHPVKATNHRGKDVTAKLREWDRNAVDEFAWRSWIGFAEDHWIELDFGERLRDIGAGDRLVLFLAGWTEYAYPESIWAANQAGLAMQPPVLEKKGNDGRWLQVAEIGFPAGMPRMMTFDLTGKLNGHRGPLRIRTNLQVFWDQLFLAKIVDRVPSPVKAEQHRLFHVTSLEVSRATLSGRGMMQEFSPDGKLPTIYDYNRLSPMPVNQLSGRLTRFGEVTELLREVDDCYVLIGPGDEMEARFDATRLPPLQPGWKRSYVLRTWGYCKDTAPFTASGDSIDPLPFRAMSTYPYGPRERYPDTSKHRDYLRRYNTRQIGQVRR